MDRSGYISFLEEALDNQRLGQRMQMALAIGIILLGAFAALVSQFLPETLGIANQEMLGTLGGLSVSAFSTFPIKQITERRTRMAALRFLLTGFRSLQDDAKEDSEMRAQLEAHFRKLMDTSLGK